MPTYVCSELVLLPQKGVKRTHIKRVPPNEEFWSDISPPPKNWRLVRGDESDREVEPVSDAPLQLQTPKVNIPTEPREVRSRSDIDAMEAPALRELIETITGQKPHHALGLTKLRALAHQANEEGAIKS